MKFIDPDGRKIETSNLSEDQLMTYNYIIDGILGNEMFNTLYNQLIESESIFTISFENRNGYNNQLVDGQFTPEANGGGNINFNPKLTYILHRMFMNVFLRFGVAGWNRK